MGCKLFYHQLPGCHTFEFRAAWNRPRPRCAGGHGADLVISSRAGSGSSFAGPAAGLACRPDPQQPLRRRRLPLRGDLSYDAAEILGVAPPASQQKKMLRLIPLQARSLAVGGQLWSPGWSSLGRRRVSRSSRLFQAARRHPGSTDVFLRPVSSSAGVAQHLRSAEV